MSIAEKLAHIESLTYRQTIKLLKVFVTLKEATYTETSPDDSNVVSPTVFEPHSSF